MNRKTGFPDRWVLLAAVVVLAGTAGCSIQKRIPVVYRETALVENLESKRLVIGPFYQKSPNFQPVSDLVRLLSLQFLKDKVFAGVEQAVDVMPVPEDLTGMETVMKILAETDWVGRYSDTGADLLLAGVMYYETRDRSGYDSEWQETRYGYRVPQKIYRNRIAFDLELGLLLVDLKTGNIVFSNVYEDTGQVEGAADEVSIFFDLINEQTSKFLDEILGRKQQTYRYLIYR